jgi:hypothetical protein
MCHTLAGTHPGLPTEAEATLQPSRNPDAYIPLLDQPTELHQDPPLIVATTDSSTLPANVTIAWFNIPSPCQTDWIAVYVVVALSSRHYYRSTSIMPLGWLLDSK